MLCQWQRRARWHNPLLLLLQISMGTLCSKTEGFSGRMLAGLLKVETRHGGPGHTEVTCPRCESVLFAFGPVGKQHFPSWSHRMAASCRGGWKSEPLLQELQCHSAWPFKIECVWESKWVFARMRKHLAHAALENGKVFLRFAQSCSFFPLFFFFLVFGLFRFASLSLVGVLAFYVGIRKWENLTLHLNKLPLPRGKRILKKW